MIARNLDVGAAHESPLCLTCHATTVLPELRGAGFAVADGVSCETCHGAAGDWIESHDDPGRTHADNVGAGMTDLVEPATLARLCASCHAGDRDRFVTHQMLAAGHPQTGFELDTFTHIQPRHHRVDADYRRRKGDAPAAAVWATGQSASMASLLERIAGASTPSVPSTAWPEFELYECSGCHAPARRPFEKRSNARGTGDFGRPLLVGARSAMLALAAETAGLPADARPDAAIRNVAVAMHSADAATLAAGALPIVRRAEAAFARWRPPREQLEALLERLCSGAMTAGYRTYADAEAATMAVQAVAASLIESGAREGDSAARLEPALDSMFRATRGEQEFRRDEFLAALKQVATAIGAADSAR